MTRVPDEQLWSWVDRAAPELDAHLAAHPEDAARVAALRAGIAAIAGKAPPLPAAIGPHRVLSLLGAGGMGVVYAAEQATTKRRVALKVPHAALAALYRERTALPFEDVRLRDERIDVRIGGAWLQLVAIDGLEAGPLAQALEKVLAPLRQVLPESPGVLAGMLLEKLIAALDRTPSDPLPVVLEEPEPMRRLELLLARDGGDAAARVAAARTNR